VAAIAAAFLGGLICAAYGIGVMIGWDPLRSVYPFVYARDDARNFLHSFLGNPEYFGGYSASLSAAAAGWFLFSRSWWARLCGFAVSVVMAACVVLSGTRAALLVLLLVGLSLLICRWPTLPGLARRRILQAAAVLAVLGVLGIGVLSTENPLNPRGMRLAQRFLNLSDFNSASVKERMLFYAIAAETSGRNPWLGAGPGSYQLEFYPRLLDMDERDESGVIARLMYDLRNRVAEQAHSDWLQAWSEGGVLGGAAFALLGAALLVRFGCWIRDRNRLVDTPLELGDALVAAGWAGATCLYLNSAFSFPLQMSARASLFYGFFAVFVAGQWMVRRVGSMDDSSSHRVS
jgi:O-antigen ligase